MHPSTTEASPVDARSRLPVPVVWWALAFGALTTAGLGVLTWGLLVVHALFYGMAAVVAPQAEAVPPDAGRYGLALGVGVTVHVIAAAVSIRLATRTAVRTWPHVAQGLLTALVAAPAAGCALLLTLGIDPLAFLLTL